MGPPAPHLPHHRIPGGDGLRRRLFDGELRRFVVRGDQVCRNSWCGAPIRHVDHVVRASDGGDTSAENAQGLCETCNHTKEAPGWSTRRAPDARPVGETITPTGHVHRSRAPDPPGARPTRAPYDSPLELNVNSLLVAA